MKYIVTRKWEVTANSIEDAIKKSKNFNNCETDIEGTLKHINSSTCWCDPTLEYKDPENGNKVWLHRQIH